MPRGLLSRRWCLGGPRGIITPASNGPERCERAVDPPGGSCVGLALGESGRSIGWWSAHEYSRRDCRKALHVDFGVILNMKYLGAAWRHIGPRAGRYLPWTPLRQKASKLVR